MIMLIIFFLTWYGNYRYIHERRKSEDFHKSYQHLARTVELNPLEPQDSCSQCAVWRQADWTLAKFIGQEQAKYRVAI